VAVPVVLIVEDDDAIGDGLVDALIGQGYDTQRVATGTACLTSAEERHPDLVLLDLGLPDIDGVDVCRHLRRVAPKAVVVVLTARDQEIDVVMGLDAGADDYLTKPFRLTELLARLRAHLRRADAPAGQADVITVGSLVVDLGSRRVDLAGRELDLRAREFDLLALLASEAGRAISRERLMSEVWDANWYGSTKTLDVHISSLRHKLGNADGSPRITTLRAVGYRLERS
jgi:DNA-binding response OmpR family regulator